MKFKDPLASLNFLGGTFPVHAAMAFFAGFNYFYHMVKIECADVTWKDLNFELDCIFFMFLAHCTYVVLFILKNMFSMTSERGFYLKVMFTFVSVVVYLAAYLYIQYTLFKPFKDNVEECSLSTSANTDIFTLINDYRNYEVFLFFAQMLALCLYIVYS